jgi:hypothetical protein
MKGLPRDRTVAGLVAVLAALVIVEVVFAPYEKPLFVWHRVPGYAALIGIGACLVVVAAAKALGRLFLHRPEGPDD